LSQIMPQSYEKDLNGKSISTFFSFSDSLSQMK